MSNPLSLAMDQVAAERIWANLGGTLTSVLIHGVVVWGLGRVANQAPLRSESQPSYVEFTAAPLLSRPAPKAASVPEPETEPEPVRVEAPARVLRDPSAPRSTEPRVETPQTSEGPASVSATPVDLTGITLGGDGDWKTSAGNGRPAALVASRASAAVARAEAPATRPRSQPRPPTHAIVEVPLASLAQRPRPPRLDHVLERHYPASARRRGLAGSALVSATIEPSGVVSGLELVSESFAGFGPACLDTLAGSRWSPPVDTQGRRVRTRVYYRCQFRVE